MLRLKAVIQCKLQTVLWRSLMVISSAGTARQQCQQRHREIQLSFCGVQGKLDPQDSSLPLAQVSGGPWAALKCYQGQMMLQSGYPGPPHEYDQCPNTQTPKCTTCSLVVAGWSHGGNKLLSPRLGANCWMMAVEEYWDNSRINQLYFSLL